MSLLLRLLVALAALLALPATASPSTTGPAFASKTASGVLAALADEEHTYFVGESGAWVHNNNGCGPSVRTLGRVGSEVREELTTTAGQVFLVKDPLVSRLAISIENSGAGVVRGVGQKIPGSEIDLLVETAGGLVGLQVKSGKTADVLGQLILTQRSVGAAMGYAPATASLGGDLLGGVIVNGRGTAALAQASVAQGTPLFRYQALLLGALRRHGR